MKKLLMMMAMFLAATLALCGLALGEDQLPAPEISVLVNNALSADMNKILIKAADISDFEINQLGSDYDNSILLADATYEIKDEGYEVEVYWPRFYQEKDGVYSEMLDVRHRVRVKVGDQWSEWSDEFTLNWELAPKAPTQAVTPEKTVYQEGEPIVAVLERKPDADERISLSIYKHGEASYVASKIVNAESAFDDELHLTVAEEGLPVGTYDFGMTFFKDHHEPDARFYSSAFTVNAQSGTCGENLTWTLEGNVLTISGSGPMTNYSSDSDVPWYTRREKIHTVDIQDGVTSIGGYAFSNCSSLTDVTIPDSVTSIDGWGAFQYCTSLTSLTFPDSVTSIAGGTFEQCMNLRSVTLPSRLTGIGAFTFAFCYRLTDVTIPAGVTSIGVNAFGYCFDLPEITIPDSVTSIGQNAFDNCSSLTEVTIPAGVTSISANPFGLCSNLAEIRVESGNAAFVSIDGALYDSQVTQIIACPGAKTGEFTFPDSVTSIGGFAFNGCSGLTEVTIPNSVTDIPQAAFQGCRGLTEVTIPAGVTGIGSGAFNLCSSLTSVTIPTSVTSIGGYAFSNCSSLTDVYYAGTETGWNAISIGENNDCLTGATIHYSTEEIPVPAFSLPTSFRAGEPIVITFPEGLSEELGASVDIVDEEGSSAASWSIFRDNLDQENRFAVIDEGLDAGTYRADVRGLQVSTLEVGTAVSSATFTVTGTRPAVPTVEIITDNAPWNGENEIRITSPGITGFILYVYDSPERMSWSTLTPEDLDALEWTQETENSITVRLNRERSSTRENWYTAAAVVDGIASAFTEEAIHLTWQEAKKAALPAFTAPESLRAGEPLVLQFRESFAEDMWINAGLYLDGEWQMGSSFSNGALDENYAHNLVENGLDSGTWELRVYAEQEGYEDSDTVIHTIRVSGERPAEPVLEVVRDGAGSREQNEIRIRAERLDSFVLYAEYNVEGDEYGFNGPVTEYEMEWTRVSDSEILVKLDKPYGTTSAKYSASAGVDGIYSRRSEQTVTLTWESLPPAPTQNLSWKDVYQAREPIVITLERELEEGESFFVNIYEAGTEKYIGGSWVDEDSDFDGLNVTVFEEGLSAGSYSLGIHFDKENCEPAYLFYKNAFMVEEGPVDEKITITVSAEELFTGTAVTVTATNPSAERIRIYRMEYGPAEIVKETEGTSCEYSVAYNVAATVQFWAEACYDGAWSGVYSEVKTVTFRSQGRLDAPTFECGTQFAPGERITVTRTNHVEHEEICMLFLSTPDHSQTLINGMPFDGKDTLTINAPTEPGEYILSVLVMAGGWDNNQTNLTIYVTDEGQPVEPPEGRTLKLPAQLTAVEDEAFANIDAEAVIIPKTVTDISGDPFAGSSVQYIFGYADSAAQTLAEEKGYTFVKIDDAWMAVH